MAAGLRPANALAGVLDHLDVAMLRRAHRRAVATSDGEHDPASDVAVSAFWDRFERWVTFEGWRDIPRTVRVLFAESSPEHYADGAEATVAGAKAARPVAEVTPGAAASRSTQKPYGATKRA